MNKPLFSIIIPLYNKENYIKNAINSVLEQKIDGADLEIIVVDDGSSDNGANIVMGLNNPKVHIVQKENGGPSSARNTGVKNSHGDWVFFLDADDIILPNCLNNFKYLIENNSDCSVFIANYFLKKGNILKPHSLFIKNGVVKNNFRSWFWENLSACQGASVYKREILLKYPYPEELRRWEDASMFFNVMKHEKVYLSKNPVFVYIMDNSNASHKIKDIRKDFLGHLSVKNKKFWEKMCNLLLYQQAKVLYPDESKLLYGKRLGTIFDSICFEILYSFKFVLRIISKIINTLSQPNISINK